MPCSKAVEKLILDNGLKKAEAKISLVMESLPMKTGIKIKTNAMI